ncbi:MAG: hypothetical protein WBE72_25860 [Terracidiphilus sp.]
MIAVPGMAASTPGFTLSAGNVSVPGQGSATSHFTLTSVDGYTGSVGVTCSGPESNVVPDLLLPNCSQSGQILVVPANGSVSGTVNFYPPWTSGSASNAQPRPARPLPLVAGVFAGFGLLGLRLRRISYRWVTLAAGAFCLLALLGFAGCLGQGGLAMTPGTYTYTLTAASSSQTQTATFSVTVQCNSCP